MTADEVNREQVMQRHYDHVVAAAGPFTPEQEATLRELIDELTPRSAA